MDKCLRGGRAVLDRRHGDYGSGPDNTITGSLRRELMPYGRRIGTAGVFKSGMRVPTYVINTRETLTP